MPPPQKKVLKWLLPIILTKPYYILSGWPLPHLTWYIHAAPAFLSRLHTFHKYTNARAPAVALLGLI